MDKRDRDRERRKQRRLEEMGTNNPVCIGCGRAVWYSFHGHHIGERQFDSHAEYFCTNCHSDFTEALKSYPKTSCKTPGAVESAGHYCLGLAVIFYPIARMLEDFGCKLVQLAKGEGITADAPKS
jgi:hypothetical protein